MTAAERIVWIYLTTDVTVKGTIEALENYCRFCGELPQQHADGKCLFDTTHYKRLGRRAAHFITQTARRYENGQLIK